MTRLVWAGALGLAGIAACGAAASGDPGPRIGEAGQGPAEAELGVDAAPPPERGQPPEADGGAPKCPHGSVDDPHHGFVRCRTAEEADAGWQPPSQGPGDSGAPTDAGAPAAPAPAPSAPPLVEIGAPTFENGDVKTVEKALTGLSKDIAKCVGDHGGLSQPTGSVKLSFLVRARERAEGVEIVSQKGVQPDAAACVKTFLKNRWVGAPSADPVGVTITLTFKPASR